MIQETAYIALGSNLGDRAHYIYDGVRLLIERVGVRVRLSPLYETQPVGYLDQPAFLNGVAELWGKLPEPRELLATCLRIESVFNVPTRIERLRSRDFLEDASLLTPENFAVDYALCPEQVITDYIRRLIEFPEALQVLNFARGRVSLVAVRAYDGGLLVGKPIKSMREHLPFGTDARIAAIFRRDQPVFPEGDTIIEAGDEVFLLASAEHIRQVLVQLRRMMKPVERIMIAGGGNIALRLARALENRYEVKVIEGRKERAEMLANELDRALVLLGDATDEQLLDQENIAEMDLFLAVTNDDEDNIMSGSLAKRLGAKRDVALINRRAYADMIEGGPIDIGISPAHVSMHFAGSRSPGRCGRSALLASRGG